MQPVSSSVTLPDGFQSQDALVPIAEAGEEPCPPDLLEFAEILDQHRLWLDSAEAAGTRGDLSGMNLAGRDLTAVNLQGALLNKTILRGADLSMANLRGANLVEADLREANLLGSEFSGANLMGANLYGAEGLWAGRLGGTNLFDATLPEAVAAHDGGKTIGQSTQSARRFYLVVVSLCVAAAGLVRRLPTSVCFWIKPPCRACTFPIFCRCRVFIWEVPCCLLFCTFVCNSCYSVCGGVLAHCLLFFPTARLRKRTVRGI